MKISKEELDRLIRGINVKGELSDKDFSTVDADDMLDREYPGVSETMKQSKKK